MHEDGWRLERRADQGAGEHMGAGRLQKELDGVQRNRVVYERISKELAALGMERTWQQCRTKIKNLTFRYRKVKYYYS